MVTLFHGTLTQHLPEILANGISEGEGWGGAGTRGTFLSGSIQGALYWAKIAYQRDAGEKMEIDRFDRDHGHHADELIAVLVVDVPESETSRLKADEEQFEDVGADFDPADWQRSLKEIGDVRFEGPIPKEWVQEVVPPSRVKRAGRRAPAVPVELDLATNMFGKLKSGPRSKVMALIQNPSQKTWDNAHGVILNSQWMTLWQAILAVDPTFPKEGKATDVKGRVIEGWPRVPDPDLVIRALKYATH